MSLSEDINLINLRSNFQRVFNEERQMTLSETRISMGLHDDWCASCARELKKGVAFRLLYEGTTHGNLFICKICIDTDKNKGLKDEVE